MVKTHRSPMTGTPAIARVKTICQTSGVSFPEALWSSTSSDSSARNSARLAAMKVLRDGAMVSAGAPCAICQGNALTFDEHRRPAPAIEVDRPIRAVSRLEAVPRAAQSFGRGEGSDRRRAHVERFGLVFDDQDVESARLGSHLEGQDRADPDEKE